MNKLHLILLFMAFAKMGFAQSEMLWTLDYDYVEKANDDFYLVIRNNLRGIADLNGKELVPPIYPMFLFHQKSKRIRALNKQDKWGLIDMNHRIIIPFIYDELVDNDIELFLVKQNNKYGFVNTKHELVIPIEYDKASSFANSVAIVSKNDKSGLINLEGKMITSYMAAK